MKPNIEANPITVERWTKPPIRLVHPDTGEKVRLQLRKMAFSKELSNLPSDMLKVHELLIEQRSNRNANTYNMVAAWSKLRVHDQYWTTFKFSSEAEYLAYYGLPDGTTLAAWTVIVSLFDKATFVLLGDEVLSYMMRAVGEYQKNIEERKKDYQSIFDLYCDAHDTFDKTVFYNKIRQFVAQKYEEPSAKAADISPEQWRRQRSANARGTSLRRRVVDVDGAKQSPDSAPIKQEFEYEREIPCVFCKEKLAIIEAWECYAEELETVIRKHLGREKLPKKPQLLRES